MYFSSLQSLVVIATMKAEQEDGGVGSGGWGRTYDKQYI